MPYQQLPDGLYLIQQTSERKGVNHYGILDLGNRMRHPLVNEPQPIVVHQRPPRPVMQWLQDTGAWNILGKITDEATALQRMREALQTPNYDLFGNNCEHFARYIATGRRESRQIQAGVLLAGLAAFALTR